jgi:hypothetical protein
MGEAFSQVFAYALIVNRDVGNSSLGKALNPALARSHLQSGTMRMASHVALLISVTLKMD